MYVAELPVHVGVPVPDPVSLAVPGPLPLPQSRMIVAGIGPMTVKSEQGAVIDVIVSVVDAEPDAGTIVIVCGPDVVLIGTLPKFTIDGDTTIAACSVDDSIGSIARHAAIVVPVTTQIATVRFCTVRRIAVPGVDVNACGRWAYTYTKGSP